MANIKIQSALFLGKEIQICVSITENVNEPPKGFTLPCDILGIKTKNYCCPKKDSFFSGLNNFSIEAITICTFMSIDLSSIENINLAVSKKDEITKEWNNIHSKCGGDWDKMIAFMSGQDMDLRTKSTSVITSTNDKVSTDLTGNSKGHINYENLKKGEVLLQSTSRSIIYNEDSISLEAIVRSGGVAGILDDAARIQNENIFLEDIRGISVYEGKSASNVLLTSMFGGNTNAAVYESISYIRFEIKGVNDIRTISPATHPYTVTISSTQINEAKELKNFLENKIREIKNSSRAPMQSQQSGADELLKYSILLEKGIISKEEFDSLKKKLLGL